MSHQYFERASDRGRYTTDGRYEAAAREKIKPLWEMGDLFHAFYRYPQREDLPRVDRLAGILKKGLIAPAACDDGTVVSDLRLTVMGVSIPYDSLVFVHRFARMSGLYTMEIPGRMIVLIHPKSRYLTPQEMGPHWVMLSQSEVYVRDRLPVENLTGLVVHPADVEQVMVEFLPDLKRLAIPLYLYDGTVVWPRE